MLCLEMRWDPRRSAARPADPNWVLRSLTFRDCNVRRLPPCGTGADELRFSTVSPRTTQVRRVHQQNDLDIRPGYQLLSAPQKHVSAFLPSHVLMCFGKKARNG